MHVKAADPSFRKHPQGRRVKSPRTSRMRLENVVQVSLTALRRLQYFGDYLLHSKRLAKFGYRFFAETETLKEEALFELFLNV